MRRILLTAAFAAGSLIAAGTTPAQACNTYSIGGVAYIDDSPLVWVYLESNGTAGLQRGGTTLGGEVAPLCGESGENPDLAVF